MRTISESDWLYEIIVWIIENYQILLYENILQLISNHLLKIFQFRECN